MKQLQPKHWLLIAAAIRVLAAFTRVNWHFPDEWYQTFEFAQLLLGHAATYTHEMGLHLRNLSWPLALTVPVQLADWVTPHWTHARLVFIQLFCGALDLASLWAFARLSKRWTPLWKNLGFVLLILPWFRVQDSVSPSVEHISVCLIWIALAALDAERFWIAGLLTMGIFAVKYPAGLVGLGFGIAILVQSVRSRRSRPVLSFFLGILAGSLVFGAADWIFYGRPWESLWMYLQYNVFTHAGVTAFGKQGLVEYFDFFRSRWLHVLFPLGVAFAFGGTVAFAKDLRRAQPWAWAFLAYVGGHLLVAHREPRFMFPAEALLLWGALKLGAEVAPNWRPQAWVSVVLGLTLIANTPFFLKAAIAESGTLNASYFEVDWRIRNTPDVCAVISQRMLNSLLLPGDPLVKSPKEPVFGFFSAKRRHPTFAQAATIPLAWYERKPDCTSSQSVLLLVDRPDVSWIKRGCRLERSGILEILPRGLWVTFLHRGWVSGPWYDCPSSILSQFKNQSQEQPFINHFEHFEKLPPLGTSAAALVLFGKRYAPQHTCHLTCD